MSFCYDAPLSLSLSERTYDKDLFVTKRHKLPFKENICDQIWIWVVVCEDLDVGCFLNNGGREIWMWIVVCEERKTNN